MLAVMCSSMCVMYTHVLHMYIQSPVVSMYNSHTCVSDLPHVSNHTRTCKQLAHMSKHNNTHGQTYMPTQTHVCVCCIQAVLYMQTL